MAKSLILQVLGRVGAVVANSHVTFLKGTKEQQERVTHLLCEKVFQRFASDEVEVVVTSTGGIIGPNSFAKHFNKVASDKERVCGIHAYQSGNTKIFFMDRSYFPLITGKKVLVFEDVLISGDTARSVVDAVSGAGGVVIGVATICNYGYVTAQDLRVPRIEALVEGSI